MPTVPTYENGSNSIHLTLGNPTRATTDQENIDNLLLIKDQYIVSYNKSLGRANWVSWHLQKSDLGTTDRQDDFRPDASLPTSWYQVRPTDYSAADGFDRGHLCSSDDRDSTAEENRSTFILTNIVPQAPQHNRQAWRLLEDYVRGLVGQGNELYIIAGTSGKGGEGDNGRVSSIASGKLTVPAALWKVIVVLPVATDDVNRINARMRVIAVWMPNTNAVGEQSWSNYRVSVDEVERQTGYDLLSNVPNDVQRAVEPMVDKILM